MIILTDCAWRRVLAKVAISSNCPSVRVLNRSHHMFRCISIQFSLAFEQHGGIIRESWVVEVNLAVTLKYNRKDMRYRTGKTISYTSKRKDTKVTSKNSADTLENEPQPTQHNAAYKMTKYKRWWVVWIIQHPLLRAPA